MVGYSNCETGQEKLHETNVKLLKGGTLVVQYGNIIREPHREVVKSNNFKMSAHSRADPTSCFYHFSYRLK